MLYNDERPMTLSQIAGQETVILSLRNQSIRDQFFQFYILAGKHGTGKTTTARIIAKMVNCEHRDENGDPCLKCPSCLSIMNGTAADVIEIDGASNNGVDNVRELIASVQFLPISLKKKVCIIDEVHKLSDGAFNALLKTLEEPPAHCVFVIGTTELNKIPATILSRGSLMKFKSIEPETLKCHIKNIASKHGFSISDEALNLIYKLSHGSMRDAIKYFDQCARHGNSIDAELVKSLFSIEDMDGAFDILRSIIAKDNAQIISKLEQLYMAGTDMLILLDDIISLVSDAVVYKSTDGKLMVQGSEVYRSWVLSICEMSLEKMFYLENELFDLREALRQDNSKTTALVRLLRISEGAGQSYEALSFRIAELETIVKQLREGIGVVTAPDLQEVKKPEVVEPKDNSVSQKAMTTTSVPDGFKNVTSVPFEMAAEDSKKTETGNVELSSESNSMNTEDEFDFLADIFSDLSEDIPSSHSEPCETDFAFDGEMCLEEEPEYVPDYPEAEDEDTYYTSLASEAVNYLDEYEGIPEDIQLDSDFCASSGKSESTIQETVTTVSAENEVAVASEEPCEEAKEELKKLGNSPIAKAAIMGAKKHCRDGNIILRVSLKPHADILLKHIEVINATHLIVEML